MERTFRGLTRSQLNQVLNTACCMEDRIKNITEEEQDAWRVAIQCVVQILNRMADGKQINWD